LATLSYRLQHRLTPQYWEVDDRGAASVSSDLVVLISYPRESKASSPALETRSHTKVVENAHEVPQIVSRMGVNFAMLNEFGSNQAVRVR
jgi:hypothetical protein